VRFHDPRYTGANRCWPCSILNGGIAAVVAGALLLAGRPVLAAGAVVVALAAIVFKGYLVPGTPQLTRRLPDSVLAVLGKSGRSTGGAGRTVATTADESEEDLAASLRAAGVVTDELRLAPAAAETIAAAAREFVDDEAGLRAAIVESYPKAVAVSVGRSLGGGEHWHALDEREMAVVQWDDRAVAALDAAAATHLAERLPSWGDRPLEERQAVLALLRHDAESCPVCESAFTTSDGPRVACCGGRSLAGDRRCPECGYALVDHADLPSDGELTVPEATDG
jgi:hypothetical protein